MTEQQRQDDIPRPWLDLYPDDVPSEVGTLEHRSIVDLVDQTCARFGDRKAFTNMGQTLTFREVKQLSDDFAAYLQVSLGLQPGDHIVLQMPNLLQYPVALFGAIKAGLVVVNANPLYTAPETKAVILQSRARAIVVLEMFADKIAEILPDTTLQNVIITRPADLWRSPARRVLTNVGMRLKGMVPKYRLPGAVDFRDAIAHGADLRLQPVSVGLDDVALLQFTGGTTGTPKGAMLTHRNLLADSQAMRHWMRVILDEGAENVLAALPLYHVFCMTVNCLCFFAYGLHNVLVTNPREISPLAKTIVRERTSVIILVSTLAQALLENPRFLKADFDFLKLTVAGGMALRESTANEWQNVTQRPMLEGYGLTEASPVVSVNPTWLPPIIGTVGIPLPSTEIKVLDDHGRVASFEEPGDLYVRGPQVMKGYWEREDETAEVLDADGWLATGDVAVLHDNGYFSIVDRRKDMISVSGFNVYPNEVEAVLSDHPRIKTAGVIGVPDEHSGEVVKAFVVPADPELTEQEVRQYARRYLTGYKRPRYIEFRDELPLSNVGKVIRRELRD
ncbi:AMP-binding protein [Pseudoclavibacter sp. CFCC 11306]|uniref:AMP-binding protein n=1 Tax=Pseudoclavibacter sp. CFCC 11306 TaxID=1564493 RepID=UPI001CE40579|nr:AMP-binding protein [Pseudoclavibacter sp. CFCC 11306]